LGPGLDVLGQVLSEGAELLVGRFRRTIDGRELAITIGEIVEAGIRRAEGGEHGFQHIDRQALVLGLLQPVVVLAVFNWPRGSDRFRKVERFVQYYFDRFDTLKKPPFHPQWKEINLAATVPGWKRYWYAEEMLKKRFSNQFPNSQLTAAATPAARADEEAVRAKLKTMGTAEQQRLYDEFLQWKRQAR
jgi:hypothetical protein